ncbi:unnamed protein product [Zymoseptoria tritici ST99CH_3D7]|uniref:Uncharacterized protein n=1 Tax=Zymoseptoria tritici (strain ST99CH_3D7) TaxID=1276538 RepID=A0A1X7RC88_ZYMT9|nr:unnamed protein product [Zymoseptoria tritici ST99CH_3D7]
MSVEEMDLPSEAGKQRDWHESVQETEVEHQTTLVGSKILARSMNELSVTENDTIDAETVLVTPPPLPHPLSRQNSGLPPTPPTMTNSEVAAAQTERAPSPPPQVFADRVRNALESRKSGIITPVGESQSPPTPDISPRGAIQHSRPPLRNDYASFTESFRTAREGLSGSGSNSMITSPVGEPDRSPDWLNIPSTTRLAVKRTGSDDSGTIQNEGSDVGEIRVKNYQVESDSDMDKTSSLHANSESPTSPLMETNNRIHRLRAPIKPGDDLKRVDNALIYGTPLWKAAPKKPLFRKKEVKLESTARLEDITSLLPADDTQESISAPQQKLSEHDQMQQIESPLQLTLPAEGYAPADVASPSTPPVNEVSLEGNNMAYRMIQEENVKRYSAISDGSGVQAVVVATPERQRTLRHTSRCESLRGASTPASSKRHSVESSHKLKHKHGRASIGSEGSPSVRPDDFYADSKIVAKPYGQLTKSSIRVVSSPLNDRPIPIANMKLPLAGDAARPHLRSISEQQPRALRRSKRDLRLDRVSSLRTDSPSHRLRRTSADQRLDRDNSVRRTSLGSDFQVEEVNPSPKLRRTSHERRLSLNNDVRRTSIPRAEEIPDVKLPCDTILEVPQGMPERHLLPSNTPMSNFSAVTEDEVCVARGMEIYPHNNSSVIMVHQVSRELQGLGVSGAHIEEKEHILHDGPSPVFEAYVQGPTTSQSALDEPSHHVDNQLDDPRTAPEPPQLVFIPPTPIDDPDRQMVPPDTLDDQVQRRPSLRDRVKRYSESLIQPIPFGRSNSFRRFSLPQGRRQTTPAERPIYLSSFWQPREFWEGYDSSDDDFEDSDGRLPPGGDTSEVAERRRSVFPRMMSVREKRNQARNDEPKPRRIFTLPFTGGTQVAYVGLSGVSSKLKQLKARRYEQVQEKRREKLRGQIRFPPGDGIDGIHEA